MDPEPGPDPLVRVADPDPHQNVTDPHPTLISTFSHVQEPDSGDGVRYRNLPGLVLPGQQEEEGQLRGILPGQRTITAYKING